MHAGHPRAPVHRIDHVGIAVPDLDEAIAFYRDTFGMEVVHEETNEEQGVREAMVAVGDSGSLHPAARPARRRARRSRSSSTAPARACSSSPTASPTSSRSPRSCASAACGCCTTAPRAAPPTAGSTSSTPRTPAACSSSWSSPPRRRTLRDAVTPATTERLPVGNVAGSLAPQPGADDVQQILDAILAGDTTRARTSPPSSSPSPTAPRRCTRTRPTCSRASPAGEGPAQVAARRGRRAARARPGRGARRGDGQRHQLQHRVDLDLRAGLDLRLPRALRPDLAAGQAARPALPRGRLRPRRRRAQDRPRRALLEARRRGRRALPVGRAREPRRPQRHDARPASSGSGASRPTSAAWPTSRWSSPTS